MPAAVNKTAGITNPANQLMITMTAISPLLMLRSPLPAIIIFRYPGKSISGIPGSQSWPKNSPAEAPEDMTLAESYILLPVTVNKCSR